MLFRFDPRFLIVLCVVSFLPSFIFVALGASSLGVGLVVACILTLLLTVDTLLNLKTLRINLLLLFSLLFFVLVTASLYIAIQYDEFKPLQSAIMMAVIVLAAYVLSEHVSRLSPKKIKSTLWAYCLIILFLGWLKLFYSPGYFNYNLHLKATFPFSEESHYALVGGFVFCVYSFIGDRRNILFLALNSFAISVLYPSLSMLVYTVLSVLILLMRMPRFGFAASLISILPLSIFGFWVLSGRMEYFSSRLDLNNLDNLTALVFVQGWQLAYLNFINTDGLGLGFQMLGSSNTVIGPLTYMIMDLASGGRALNLSDGGFLAAKIIAEFGVLGVCFLLFYAYKILTIPLRANSINNSNKTEREFFILLKFGVIFSLSPEVFLRGYGYFSPSLVILLMTMLIRRQVTIENNGRRMSNSKSTTISRYG